MDRFQQWLYASPLGTVVKVLAGTVLGALGAWSAQTLGASSGLSAVAYAVIQAAIPVLVNYLNPDDPRTGRTR